MNRRELLGKLTQAAVAAGIVTDVEAKIVPAEPKPLLAILRIDGEVRSEQMARLKNAWNALWTGTEEIPLVILDKEDDLEIVTFGDLA